MVDRIKNDRVKRKKKEGTSMDAKTFIKDFDGTKRENLDEESIAPTKLFSEILDLKRVMVVFNPPRKDCSSNKEKNEKVI